MSKAENIKLYYSKKYKEKKDKERNIVYAESLRYQRYLSLEDNIWENVINRINSAFMSQNAVRNYSYKELIGCNKTELLEHLKTSNKTNLSIELYPELEVDHIFPISKFNLKNIDEQKRCSHFTSYIKT